MYVSTQNIPVAHKRENEMLICTIIQLHGSRELTRVSVQYFTASTGPKLDEAGLKWTRQVSAQVRALTSPLYHRVSAPWSITTAGKTSLRNSSTRGYMLVLQSMFLRAPSHYVSFYRHRLMKERPCWLQQFSLLICAIGIELTNLY